jgi:hypothetical protein
MQKPAMRAGRPVLAVAGAINPEALAGVVFDLEIIAHSPQLGITRSGPSARLTRRLTPRQVNATGGWSGKSAIASIGSGIGSKRAGRGH